MFKDMSVVHDALSSCPTIRDSQELVLAETREIKNLFNFMAQSIIPLLQPVRVSQASIIIKFKLF